MILVVVTVRVLPERTETFEGLLRDLLPKMRSSEPGTLVHEAGRSREEPNVYRYIELYKDPEAVEQHRAGMLLAAVKDDIYACIDGDFDVRMHDTF